TVLVLYAGCKCLQENGSKWGLAGLLGLALLGPWVSYPAVFSLIGVGIAWLVAAFRRRQPLFILGLLAYAFLGACSCTLFWQLVGRHQHTSSLTTWWQFAFWDFSSLSAALGWPVLCLRHMTDYATTGLGIPFLLLAPLGLWWLAKRRGATVLMVL